MDVSIENYGTGMSSCSYDGDILTLGYEFITAQKVLSDKDFNTFLCDAIRHEVLHSVIQKEFNTTTSKLFDAIEHFIGTFKFKEQVFEYLRYKDNSSYPMTYQDDINNNGFNAFLDYYHIDNIRLIQAYIICNNRR